MLITISPLESPLSSKFEEGKRFEIGIGATIRCVDEIQALIRLVLERLQKCIFSRWVGVVMGSIVVVEKPMEIMDSSDKKSIDVKQWLITVVPKIQKTTNITLEEMQPQMIGR